MTFFKMSGQEGDRNYLPPSYMQTPQARSSNQQQNAGNLPASINQNNLANNNSSASSREQPQSKFPASIPSSMGPPISGPSVASQQTAGGRPILGNLENLLKTLGDPQRSNVRP